jgi:hypothetical protein
VTVLIHEFPLAGSKPCGCIMEHDGFTARADAVTCQECRERQRVARACPSRSARYGWRCFGEPDHGGLHHAELHGRFYAWTDESSPELAIDLDRRL